MINKFLVTGDCHGSFSRFAAYTDNNYDTGVIILGDAGFNFYLDERDDYMKDWFMRTYQFTLYCVRGNHEARPTDVCGMKVMYDDNVKGVVYFQSEYPRIRYFVDGCIYQLGKYAVGVIGGAYSVDKPLRLKSGAPWFPHEQLSEQKRAQILKAWKGKGLDFVLTHTCPRKWEPTDLFLSNIDQSTVDKTMEDFLDKVEEEIAWGAWLFGHYHADRLERPYVEQYYTDTENLDEIRARWNRWCEEGELDWWLHKSPNFYKEEKSNV